MLSRSTLQFVVVLASALTAFLTAIGGATAQAAPWTGKPVVAFLGDSYTAGTGGDKPYWETTSELMCWNGLNLGKYGTGYINPGRKGGVFASRVDVVVQRQPSIVIVQGSYNDKDPQAVGPAAEKLFKILKQRLPEAKLFAMSPVSRPKKGSAQLVDSNTFAVRQAAQEVGIDFIDARKFVKVDKNLFRKDLAHPNARGHLLIGKSLAETLPEDLNACPER